MLLETQERILIGVYRRSRVELVKIIIMATIEGGR